MFFQCIGEYRRKYFKYVFELLIGKEACQLDTFTRPSWGHEQTYETIPISVCGP